ncbi:hypothetical protein GPA22_14710 [Aromatoleum toluvorans]|uniref:DUF2029 domain-containing protein n=1 Tax=Aromatoleum toluvorans TaxID=92002 RepID=A0ABX1Q3Q4_9RHOO|nr:hypothetical protein [Aromatoleum toluvorans]NMG44976.1 hypothetical protein [Aromatoleum toluvorans]
MNAILMRTGLALCLVPGVLFGLSLLLEHHAWLWDATVYRCAIDATLAHDDPYRFVGDCAGYFLPHTYPYAGTRLLAGLATMTGTPLLGYAYVLAYAAGSALFLYAAGRIGGSTRAVALLVLAPAAGVFVSELVSGNMGVPFYGALLWLIWRGAGGRPVTALGVAMAPFKPLYAAYLLLPFFQRREILLPFAGALAVAAWYGGDALLFPVHFADWLRAATGHANEVPGFGFSMLVRKSGMELQGGTAIVAAYALWAAFAVVLTLRAVARAPTPLLRALVAVAGTALLLPRLKEYDCLMLIPLALALWPTLDARERREWLALVGGFGIALPATIWWLRKLALVWGTAPATWRSLVDMRWLVQNQGAFLFAALLAALVWLAFRSRDAAQPA